MKLGIWFYGLGTVLAGILDIVWREFEPSHQPIKVLGNLPGHHILACVVGVWMVAAGLAILWQRTVKIGAAASAAAYAIFAALWLFRYYAAIHVLGWRIDVFAGITFGLGQQLLLIAPAAILYATSSPVLLFQKRAATAARWMLGLPPIVFGLSHLIGLRVFAPIVPHWMSFGYFWAGFTGIAFFLAGYAICSGIMDVPAARLLALMLLLFEFLVEIPPIFVRSHNQATWGAAVYNVAAIGACWIFAELIASRAGQGQTGPEGSTTQSRHDPVIA